MLQNDRVGIHKAIADHLGAALTPAERRLIDRALDQVEALRALHR